jgi:UDP-glucuronate decarboxylase
LDIKVARIFNTYGPKMDPNDGRVVSNFIMQALQNRDITIFGDGHQTRSFCYVDDLIEGFLRFMALNDSTANPLPINLGNPFEFTVLELAKKVISLTGSSSKLVSLPLPQDDPTQRQPDISRAKKLLQGWEPKVMLDEGLVKTISYFEGLLQKGK